MRIILLLLAGVLVWVVIMRMLPDIWRSWRDTGRKTCGTIKEREKPVVRRGIYTYDRHGRVREIKM